MFYILLIYFTKYISLIVKKKSINKKYFITGIKVCTEILDQLANKPKQ